MWTREFRYRPILLGCWQDGHDGDDSKQSTADMTAFVQNLLQQMQSRFQAMSDSIITKNILSMGNRIDELEQSINDLKAEMGVEGGSPSPSVPSKPEVEPKSGDDSA
ncbi:Heat shock factor binding [Parasponia andersonii]|uniref:Heat shock factor binding n=1 Tax=Parasponia andersonii TaxID=3476 RepID=A0A2P5E487_PARAD|nr:Heat shock factor binding [Parasponia andersonii]